LRTKAGWPGRESVSFPLTGQTIIIMMPPPMSMEALPKASRPEAAS
jgi:hypothetical protein